MTNFNFNQNQTIPFRVAEELAKQIASGELKANERLTEKTISSKFNISHIPAREALKFLEKDGYIKILPYKGAIINSIDLDEVLQGAQVQLALLPLILKKTVANMNDAIIQKLTSLIKQAEQSKNPHEHYELFQNFIFTYYDASELLHITAIIKSYMKKLTLGGDWFFGQDSKEVENTIKHQKLMLAALKKKNYKEALTIRSEYLKKIVQDFEAQLNERK